MNSLGLHEYHQSLKASFTGINGEEAVVHYGDTVADGQRFVLAVGDEDARQALLFL